MLGTRSARGLPVGRRERTKKTKCSLRPLRLRSIIYISHSRLGDAVHDAFFEAGFAVGNEKSGRERRKEGDTKRETFERERKQAQENIQSAAAKENFSPLSLLNQSHMFIFLPSPHLFFFFLKLDKQSDPERQRQSQGRRHRCPAREGPHLRRLYPQHPASSPGPRQATRSATW